MNRFSLRVRIVALAVALVAFAVTLLGVATYVALRGYLNDRLDDQVASIAPSQQSVCGPGGGSGQSASAASVGSSGVVASISCSKYRIVQPLKIRAQDLFWLAALTETTDPFTLRTADGGTYRVRAFPGATVNIDPDDPSLSTDEDRGPVTGTLVVGLSTMDVDNTSSRVLGLEVIIGLIAVVGTAVLSAAGVRLGLRPLDRVTRTARTVAAELGPDGRGLDNRVPDADPRTEVGQLAEAVNTMLGAVEREYTARYESEQRLRRFLADASHELRTPLTSLRGYAELVRMRGGLDADASDSLRRIETEGKRMGGLVDDLLTLARSDRGVAVERKPVDLVGVVDDAAAGVRAAHPARPVEVTVTEPLPVLGDRDQLLQVVTNVVSNAAVHATADLPIRIAVEQAGGEAVVRVADGGPGLPPEQAAQVFERFWRADAARTRVRGGSGLGMSIVHALVTDHGGTVRFESAVDTGTTVTIRLPVAPDPTHPDPSAKPPDRLTVGR